METCTDGVVSDQGHRSLGDGGIESLGAGEPQGTGPRGCTGKVSMGNGLSADQGHLYARAAVIKKQMKEWWEGPALREPEEELPYRKRLCPARKGPGLQGLGTGHFGAAGEESARLAPCGCCQFPLRVSSPCLPPPHTGSLVLKSPPHMTGNTLSRGLSGCAWQELPPPEAPSALCPSPPSSPILVPRC